MPKQVDPYETAADVLLATADGPVKLSDHCEIYDKSADDVIDLLRPHAEVIVKTSNVPARSKAGAFIASPLGARVMGRTVTVKQSAATLELLADADRNKVIGKLRGE